MAYIPVTDIAGANSAIADLYGRTDAVMRALGSSNPASYLPLAGGILTGGVSVTTPGGQWLTGKTGTGGINAGAAQTASAFHPILRQTTSSGHVIAMGGLGDKFGFYRYLADRTANGTDGNLVWDMAANTLVFNDNTIWHGGNFDPAGKANTSHTQDWSTVTGKPTTFAPAAHNQDWTTVTGKPSAYTPATHTHAIADVTSLQTTINNIVARGGTDANGYARFSDNVQICWVVWTGTCAITTAWGSGYDMASPISLGSFAAAFAAQPAVTVTFDSGDGAYLGMAGMQAVPTTTSWGSVNILRMTSATVSNGKIVGIAIGRY